MPQSGGKEWDINLIRLGPTGDLTVHFEIFATDGTNGIKTHLEGLPRLGQPWWCTTEWERRFGQSHLYPPVPEYYGGSKPSIRIELTTRSQAPTYQLVNTKPVVDFDPTLGSLQSGRIVRAKWPLDEATPTQKFPKKTAGDDSIQPR